MAQRKNETKPASRSPRRFLFEREVRQRVWSVALEKNKVVWQSGVRFGSMISQLEQKFSSAAKAEEGMLREIESRLDDDYRELNEREYEECIADKRFASCDDDLRALFSAEEEGAEADCLERERAERIAAVILGDTEIGRCKTLELCFPPETLEAVIAALAAAQTGLAGVETLVLRVPGEMRGKRIDWHQEVSVPCESFAAALPRIKSLQLCGRAAWRLCGTECGSLTELTVAKPGILLQLSVSLPSLELLSAEQSGASPDEDGEFCGEEWNLWFQQMHTCCPHLQQLLAVNNGEQRLEMLDAILRSPLCGGLTHVEAGYFEEDEGDRLCAMLVRSMPFLIKLKKFTVILPESSSIMLQRKLQAFPVSICVKLV